MPFAYLRKLRVEEERQRQRARRLGQTNSQTALVAASSPYRAFKIALIAVLVAPVLVYLPWLHSALGPGGMPEWWVRPGEAEEVSPDCWNVPGGEKFKLCEDMQHVPGATTDTVLISCDANRAGWNTVMGPLNTPGPRGSLFTYEYPTLPSQASNKSRAVPVDILDFPEDSSFHPLGISILASSNHDGDENGSRRLFVVNHRRFCSSIEVFDLRSVNDSTSGTKWAAHWRRSVVHPLATHTPNSIHALTPTSFIVTNDHLFARRPGPVDSHTIPLLTQLYAGTGAHINHWIVSRIANILSHPKAAAALAQVETLLGLPLGWVTLVEFDSIGMEDRGVRAKVLARGIPFANGLAVTPDQKTLIVAATTYPGIWIYDVLQPTTSPYSPRPSNVSLSWSSVLKLDTKLHLPFRVDNLAFSHPSPSSSSSDSDRFNNLKLLATGHPAPLKLISMSRNPLQNTSPSWTVCITPHNPSAASKPQPWEDNSSPLPAHHFTLSHNPNYHIRTLLQTTGKPQTLPHRNISLPSSSSSLYHPSSTNPHTGTLLVSSLYGPFLTCTNIAT